jgi:hypothetical protein
MAWVLASSLVVAVADYPVVDAICLRPDSAAQRMSIGILASSSLLSPQKSWKHWHHAAQRGLPPQLAPVNLPMSPKKEVRKEELQRERRRTTAEAGSYHQLIGLIGLERDRMLNLKRTFVRGARGATTSASPGCGCNKEADIRTIEHTNER